MYKRQESESQHARVLRILGALAKAPEATARELSETTQIPRSTVYRILEDSMSSGFIRKTSTSHYGAGPIAVQLAERYRDTTEMHGTLTPYLRELSQATGELTAFMVVHGAEAVCVESVESERALRCSYTVGASQPLTVGATATALLSQVSQPAREEILEYHHVDAKRRKEIERLCAQSRVDGYSVSVGTLDEGVWGVSAAVKNGRGELQGAVTLMAPVQRISHRESRLIQLTCRTAKILSGGIK